MARFLSEQSGALPLAFGGSQDGFMTDVVGGPRAARITGDELPRLQSPRSPLGEGGGFTPPSPFFQLGALGGLGPVNAPNAPGFDPMEALVQQLENARRQFLQAYLQQFFAPRWMR